MDPKRVWFPLFSKNYSAHFYCGRSFRTLIYEIPSCFQVLSKFTAIDLLDQNVHSKIFKTGEYSDFLFLLLLLSKQEYSKAKENEAKDIMIFLRNSKTVCFSQQTKA